MTGRPGKSSWRRELDAELGVLMQGPAVREPLLGAHWELGVVSIAAGMFYALRRAPGVGMGLTSGAWGERHDS